MQYLFCYGTLMYRPLLEHLTARSIDCEAARLPDFTCRNVKRADYPAIAPSVGSVVSGLLVRGVPPAAWQPLDRYEGEMYRRTMVFVQTADGEKVEAWTYVIRPRYLARMGQRNWQYSRAAENYAKAQLEAMLDAEK